MLQREETISGEPNWFCSCESYQILMSTVEMNFGSNNFEGLKCLHCHIFENIVDLVSIYLILLGTVFLIIVCMQNFDILKK